MAVRVPPPAIFAAVFLVALWIEAAVYRIWLVDDTRTPLSLVAAGGLLVVLGAAVALWAMWTFHRAHTTILPYRQASAMVTNGPYAWSRNPIYVGLTLMHIGGSLMLNAGWPILLLPVALVLLWVFVIRGEERMMRETFGDAYDDYRQRVRRWL